MFIMGFEQHTIIIKSHYEFNLLVWLYCNVFDLTRSGRCAWTSLMVSYNALSSSESSWQARGAAPGTTLSSQHKTRRKQSTRRSSISKTRYSCNGSDNTR